MFIDCSSVVWNQAFTEQNDTSLNPVWHWASRTIPLPLLHSVILSMNNRENRLTYFNVSRLYKVSTHFCLDYLSDYLTTCSIISVIGRIKVPHEEHKIRVAKIYRHFTIVRLHFYISLNWVFALGLLVMLMFESHNSSSTCHQS